jgi:SAM-dependent methyltransferase
MIRRLLGWVRQRRSLIEAELVTIEQRRELSPVFYAQATLVLPLLQRYARGKLIDLGCGSAPFWPNLVDHVEVYHGIDLWPRSDHTSFAGDIQSLAMVRDATYDSAMCIEVLEHVPDPFAAVASIARVLKPGGVAVISVPHLSRLHDVPHDYFRFTGFGLAALLARAGLEVVELHAKGGLFSFLGHQVATVLLALAWSLPPLQRPLLFANQWLVTRPCVALDRLIHTAATFPQGYVAVAAKPHASQDAP